MRTSRYNQIKDLYPHLTNPSKYIGSRPVVMRSGWEISFAIKFLDKNPSVRHWASESNVIPYFDPVDRKQHRYFVDFWMECETENGIREYLLEIKPNKFCSPPKEPKRKTDKYMNEVKTYIKNQSKWASAEKYCEQLRLMGKKIEFKVLTEDDIP